jgi:hypothetical protein
MHYMSWANKLASVANDAANDRVASNEGVQRTALSGSWDPHQVWLTRIKQPRDGRQLSPNPIPANSPSPTAAVNFWRRAAR